MTAYNSVFKGDKMSKFQRELILALAREYDLRSYDYDSYILIIDTMGEKLKCKTVAQFKEWIGE